MAQIRCYLGMNDNDDGGNRRYALSENNNQFLETAKRRVFDYFFFFRAMMVKVARPPTRMTDIEQSIAHAETGILFLLCLFRSDERERHRYYQH